MSKTLFAVWTEQPGIALDIVDDGAACHIVARDRGQETPETPAPEVSRWTLALDGRRASVGEAILPGRDQTALKIGRLVMGLHEELMRWK